METANINFHRSRGGRRQICKACGCPDKFDFNVPDEMWRGIVPREYRHGVVCLDCFDSFASEKGIDYSESKKFSILPVIRLPLSFKPYPRMMFNGSSLHAA